MGPVAQFGGELPPEVPVRVPERPTVAPWAMQADRAMAPPMPPEAPVIEGGFCL